MERRLLLAGISAGQLGAGVLGMALAIRRRHAYRFLMLEGDRDRVGRDAMGIGTALSPPAPMLLTQVAATARLLRPQTTSAERVLGFLGAGMVLGYLGEDLVRQRLRPSGWDPVESPVAVLGLGLAAAMAVAGLGGRGGRSRGGALARLITHVDENDWPGQPAGQMSFSAVLKAECMDGRQIELLNDRGWSESLLSTGASSPSEPWSHATREHLEETALTVVGPDEPPERERDEEAADMYWSYLAAALAKSGVTASAQDLRSLPHVVVLSDRLRRRIAGAPPA